LAGRPAVEYGYRRGADAAMIAGRNGMAARDAFTDEEWARVVGAPMLAGIAVTAADPGGLWGALRESAATAAAMRTARTEGAAGDLIGQVVAAYETAEGREMARGVLRAQATGKKPAEVVEAALAELAAVAALVAAKASGQAPAFKAWLQEIAGNVAEAGTEGGFLGFGGVKVSEAEKATLARLADVLA
jgi:hypothetical protein